MSVYDNITTTITHRILNAQECSKSIFCSYLYFLAFQGFQKSMISLILNDSQKLSNTLFVFTCVLNTLPENLVWLIKKGYKYVFESNDAYSIYYSFIKKAKFYLIEVS